MRSRERVARAMAHLQADRVPVMCQLSFGHYALNMKNRWKPHEIFFTSEAFADSLVTLCRQYRFDGILINIPGRDPDWCREVQSIHEQTDGEIIRWKDGTKTWMPWDDNPQYDPFDLDLASRPTFDTFDPDKDFDRLDEWPRYTWGVYHVPYIRDKTRGLLLQPPDHFVRTINAVKAAVGDSVSIHGEIFSPFTHFMELFNYEEALIGLVSEPPKALEILQRFSSAAIAWAFAQADSGVDAILISSAFAGGGFISPSMYAKFVVPFERMIADSVHAAYPNMPVYTHTCGMINDRLQLLVESRVDGIDTLDPPPLGNTKLADAKALIGDKLFIKGNINSVAILNDTEEQFRERAIRTLRDGKPGGGYILSTACSVAPYVEPWKLELLADIADEYGQYE